MDAEEQAKWQRLHQKRQRQIEKEQLAARRQAEQQHGRQRQHESHDPPPPPPSSASSRSSSAKDNPSGRPACGKTNMHAHGREQRIPPRTMNEFGWRGGAPSRCLAASRGVASDIASNVAQLFRTFYIPIIWAISICVFFGMVIYGTKMGFGGVARMVTGGTTTRATMETPEIFPGTAAPGEGGGGGGGGTLAATPLGLFPEGGDLQRSINYLKAVDTRSSNGPSTHLLISPHDPCLRLVDAVFQSPTWNENWDRLLGITAGIRAQDEVHTMQMAEQLQRDVRAATVLLGSIRDRPAVAAQTAHHGGIVPLLGWASDAWALIREVPGRTLCWLGLGGGDKGCCRVQRTVLRRIDAFRDMVSEAEASRRSATLLSGEANSQATQLQYGLCMASQRMGGVTALGDAERRLSLSDGVKRKQQHAEADGGAATARGLGAVQDGQGRMGVDTRATTLRLRDWEAACFYLCKQASMAIDWLDARREFIQAEEKRLRRQYQAALKLRNHALVAGCLSKEAVQIEGELEAMLGEFLSGLEGYQSEE